MAESPLRILMTVDTYGGVWDYALELAAGLSCSGTAVLLASMGRPASLAQRRAAGAIPGLILREVPCRLEWMPEPEEDLEIAAEWLLDLEKKFCPDIIHLNGYSHAPLPWRAPCLVVAHSCVFSWWSAVRGGNPSDDWRRYRERVIEGLRAADSIVAPTAALLQAMEPWYGHLTRARVIPNGRDPGRYFPDRKESFFFCAGRLWDEAKNASMLTRVAPLVPWPILLAGDFQHPGGGGSPPEEVRCLGILSEEEMRRRLSRASVYLHPARYEPFGLTILEAALSQCALVLGDIPTLRELWDGAALFIHPDDHQAWTDQLRSLAANRSQRELLGRQARKRALGYRADRMVQSYRQLYRELIERRRCATPPVPVRRPGFRSAATSS